MCGAGTVCMVLVSKKATLAETIFRLWRESFGHFGASGLKLLDRTSFSRESRLLELLELGCGSRAGPRKGRVLNRERVAEEGMGASGIGSASSGVRQMCNGRMKQSSGIKMSSTAVLLMSGMLLVMWISSHCLHNGTFGSVLGISGRMRAFLGSLGVLGVVAAFSISLLPRGIFWWPSYGLWKVLLGLNITYLLLLVFLLFQNAEGIRRALVFIDPNLARKVLEVNYMGSSCSLLDESQGGLSNLYSKLDLFVMAHFVGWLIKTLILRNDLLVWFNSIFFEWLEITFRHILPNFFECWWDHILLDIFGCNMLGIIAGNFLIRRLSLTPFDWASAEICTETTKKAVSPSRVQGYAFSTLRKFVFFLVATAVVQMIDLNYFFFKAEFSMPVSHWIFGIRTLLLAACGAAAARELYEALSRNSSNDSYSPFEMITLQCWTLMAAILTESVLCWRFKENLKASTFFPPNFISYIWVLLFLLFFALLSFILVKSFWGSNWSDGKKDN